MNSYQPINYNIDIKNPINSALKGYSEGLDLKEKTQKLTDLDRQRQMAIQMQKDIFGLSSNKNAKAEDYSNLMIKYPQISESLKKSWDVLNESQQKNMLSKTMDVYSALETGDVETATKLLESEKQAALNSGLKEEADKKDILLKQIKVNPDAVKTSLGMLMSTIDKDFAKNKETLSMLPGNLKKQQADIRLVDAQIVKYLAEAKKAGKEGLEKEGKNLRDFRQTVLSDKTYQGARSAYDTASSVMELLKSHNPIADNAVKGLLPRLLREVGNLSEYEQKRWGGSEAINAQLNQIITTWNTGKISKKNREFLTGLVESLDKDATKTGNDRIKEFIESETSIGDIPRTSIENIIKPIGFKERVWDTEKKNKPSNNQKGEPVSKSSNATIEVEF